MGLKKNEKLGDELQFLSAKNALSRSGGFRKPPTERDKLGNTHTPPPQHHYHHRHHHLHRKTKIFVVNTQSLLNFYYQTYY
jgi:hypothetical protein